MVNISDGDKMKKPTLKTLILGVGNLYRQDDGVGIKVIQKLIANRNNYDIPPMVSILDGGTEGLGLIEYFKDYEKIILVDAVEMQLPAGEIKVFLSEEAILTINSDSLSTHGFGIAEVLKLAKQLDINSEIIIVGIQPQSLDFIKGLTKKVELAVDKVVDIILEKFSN